LYINNNNNNSSSGSSSSGGGGGGGGSGSGGKLTVTSTALSDSNALTNSQKERAVELLRRIAHGTAVCCNIQNHQTDSPFLLDSWVNL